jgi:hypothetical protein
MLKKRLKLDNPAEDQRNLFENAAGQLFADLQATEDRAHANELKWVSPSLTLPGVLSGADG